METNLGHYRQEIIKAMSSYENYIDVLNEKFGFIKKNYRNERLTNYEKYARFIEFCLEEYKPRFEITKLEKFILENVTGTTITKHGFRIVIEGYQYYEEEDDDKEVMKKDKYTLIEGYQYYEEEDDEKEVMKKDKYTLNDLASYFESAYFDGLKDNKTYFIDEILENYEVVEID